MGKPQASKALIDDIEYAAAQLHTETNGTISMKTFIKTMIIISAVSAFSAQAENDLTAKFAYSPIDSIETTYAKFEGTTRKACKIHRAEVAELHTRSRMEKACRTELMDKAVAATPLQGLEVYHAQMIDSQVVVVASIEEDRF